MTTIYLDFDNTVVESNKQVIEILNYKYNENKTEDDLWEVGCNSIHNISEKEKLSIFENDAFFNNLIFKPYAVDIINKHCNNFNWVITTKGTQKNLDKKFKWIDENFPFKVEKVGIINDGFSKASVNMKGGIQIDDTFDSLDTNADIKILYKDYKNYRWQKLNPCDDILVVNSWEDIDKILEFYSVYDHNSLVRKEDLNEECIKR